MGGGEPLPQLRLAAWITPAMLAHHFEATEAATNVVAHMHGFRIVAVQHSQIPHKNSEGLNLPNRAALHKLHLRTHARLLRVKPQ
jgi:hypothetical protein